MNIDTARYLESIEAHYSRHYAKAVSDMIVAKAMRNDAGLRAARTELERVISQTMGIAEVLGAASMLRKAADVHVEMTGEAFRRHARDLLLFKDSPDLLAEVTFQEALQDLAERTPVYLKDAAERTAQRISQLYGEGRVMAFAKSAEQAVTDRVQALIVQAVKDGVDEASAGTLIRMGVDTVRTETEAWTEAYSRMAFRTNVNTAVTAGRFRQAQDPDVKAVMPAFQFQAVGDVDTRDNHQALDGRIYKVDNPVWNRIAPPLGFNCRCTVSPLSLPMLRRMGRIGRAGVVEDSVPAGGHPDPGFRYGGRPDLFMVSA